MPYLYSMAVFGGLLALTSAVCSSSFGPPGSTECVQLHGYNAPQYATCLSDTYIQAKSGDKHTCRIPTARYCWYQCMCEINNECDGPDVYRNCACDLNGTNTNTTTTLSPQTTLPPWCFSPSGQQCFWYRDCLEKRYPCEGTDAAYAITYAKKFCDLYSDHSKAFSSDGQRWIDAVRKCLQVELVPILRPWVTTSCGNIKDRAFASHTKCYTSPAAGVSYCSLSWSDKWEIFWTIKGAFISAFVETMIGIRDTLYECITSNNERVSLQNSDVALTQVYVRKPESMDESPDAFAGQTIDAIAKQEKWKEQGLVWFGYSGDDERRKRRAVPQPFRIDIILASKRIYDLNSPSAPVVNISETLTSFANSVNNGLPGLTVNGFRVNVLSMAACIDISCNSTYMEVNATVENDMENKATSTVNGQEARSIGTGNVFSVSSLFVSTVGIVAILLSGG